MLAETLLVTAALHAYLLLWRPSLGWDLVAVLITFAVVVLLFRRRGESARSLGVTDWEGNRDAARRLGPVVLVMAAGATAFRLSCGPLHEARPLFPGIAIAALTYPLWGFLQQLFYLGFVQRGLARGGGLPLGAAGAAAGVLYGLSHAPNWPLVAVTAPMGVVFGIVYARAPGLLAIGVAHGLGGALALYVLGMDLEVGARFGRVAP